MQEDSSCNDDNNNNNNIDNYFDDDDDNIVVENNNNNDMVVDVAAVVDNGNYVVITDADRFVYQFDYAVHADKFIAASNKCVILSNAHLHPLVHPEATEYQIAEENEVVAQTKEVFQLLESHPPDIHQLIFKNVVDEQDVGVPRLFSSIGMGKYPNLSSLNLDSFTVTEAGWNELIDVVMSGAIRLWHLKLDDGNIRSIDKGRVDANSLQTRLLVAISRNTALRKVEIGMKIGEHAFQHIAMNSESCNTNNIKSLWFFGISCETFGAMRWLRCFKQVEKIHFRVCELDLAAFKNIRDMAHCYLRNLKTIDASANDYTRVRNPINGKKPKRVSVMAVLRAIIKIRSLCKFAMHIDAKTVPFPDLKMINKLLEQHPRVVLNDRETVSELKAAYEYRQANSKRAGNIYFTANK